MELAVAALVAASLAIGVEPAADQSDLFHSETRLLTAGEMFALASRAAGDLTLAQRVHATLAQDSNLEVRSEARFRLVMLLMKLNRL